MTIDNLRLSSILPRRETGPCSCRSASGAAHHLSRARRITTNSRRSPSIPTAQPARSTRSAAASDFRPPADACFSFRALYAALEEFEQDLHRHVHLENNVLFPHAVELEAAAYV
ncbi:MAG TPA: hypothetical protein VK422_02710 [Pyrinomonadaceae bacterium]|nr:hypothetical protein [Pyrinomonadaceae bacterium]